METIAIEGNGSRPSHKGSGYSEGGAMFTLNATEIHGVVYPVENHPADSRVSIGSGNDPIQTLTSRMETGGGNVPMVLAVYDSHPQDSRIKEIPLDGIGPTVTTKYQKLVADVPLVVTGCKQVISYGHDERSCQFTEGITDPLTASDYKQPTIIAYERR